MNKETNMDTETKKKKELKNSYFQEDSMVEEKGRVTVSLKRLRHRSQVDGMCSMVEEKTQVDGRCSRSRGYNNRQISSRIMGLTLLTKCPNSRKV